MLTGSLATGDPVWLLSVLLPGGWKAGVGFERRRGFGRAHWLRGPALRFSDCFTPRQKVGQCCLHFLETPSLCGVLIVVYSFTLCVCVCVRACMCACMRVHAYFVVCVHAPAWLCVCINFVHTNMCGFIKWILQFFSNEKTIKVKVTSDLWCEI